MLEDVHYPEQRLKKYIEYKFNSIGGMVETVPENYTSKACPSCYNKDKPQNRVYKCPECGFTDDRGDRDVIGQKTF